jgi:hypothetical protein
MTTFSCEPWGPVILSEDEFSACERDGIDPATFARDKIREAFRTRGKARSVNILKRGLGKLVTLSFEELLACEAEGGDVEAFALRKYRERGDPPPRSPGIGPIAFVNAKSLGPGLG